MESAGSAGTKQCVLVKNAPEECSGLCLGTESALVSGGAKCADRRMIALGECNEQREMVHRTRVVC